MEVGTSPFQNNSTRKEHMGKTWLSVREKQIKIEYCDLIAKITFGTVDPYLDILCKNQLFAKCGDKRGQLLQYRSLKACLKSRFQDVLPSSTKSLEQCL